jgi:hypothetical protein
VKNQGYFFSVQNFVKIENIHLNAPRIGILIEGGPCTNVEHSIPQFS